MLSVSLGLAAVNQAVKEGKASQTLRVMRLPEVALRSVVAECATTYQTELSALLHAKSMEGQSYCHILDHYCTALRRKLFVLIFSRTISMFLTGLQRSVYIVTAPFYSCVSHSNQVITKAHGLGQRL